MKLKVILNALGIFSILIGILSGKIFPEPLTQQSITLLITCIIFYTFMIIITIIDKTQDHKLKNTFTIFIYNIMAAILFAITTINFIPEAFHAKELYPGYFYLWTINILIFMETLGTLNFIEKEINWK